jgi:DNA-binding LytR/AlgR family response regulator
MHSKKILIIEDDDEINRYLEYLLKKLRYQTVGIVKNYFDALDSIAQTNPDLLLVDIKLKGEKSGLDIAQDVANTSGIPVIFVTSVSITDVLEDIRLPNVKGFLSKPFKEDDLYAAIELATNSSHADQKSLASAQSIYIRQNTGFTRLNKNDIRYLEADGSYTSIYAERKYVIRKTLKESEELVNSSAFLRIHRSYLINEKYVVNIQPNTVELEGIRLPLSKSGHDLIKTRFNL